MAKGQPKTMRFEDDVEAYIDKQKGDNFSEKFHNLVRRFRDEEKEKMKVLAALDRQIAEKEKRIRDLSEFLFNTDNFERQFRSLQSSLKGCQGYLENFLKKDIEKVISPKKLEKLDMDRLTG